ncbi:hypothetical protein GS399_05205 [Pedobacter sp. HMF7647]|uniref:Uncharacterized protein n=1 Tax=Hufsiella arboris TaxID=2695275 RepID=A0A7K1Y710_9SPHI|nr:hypothetical protein [Hufsiella arboris]MXV50362.1 hypothetical protein [Hufsiella arboris]
MSEPLNTTTYSIMQQPVQELGLSEVFSLRSKLMGFRTLEDIANTPVQQLLSKEDFNYNWLGELVGFMTQKNLLDRLQELPGSNAY